MIKVAKSGVRYLAVVFLTTLTALPTTGEAQTYFSCQNQYQQNLTFCYSSPTFSDEERLMCLEVAYDVYLKCIRHTLPESKVRNFDFEKNLESGSF